MRRRVLSIILIVAIILTSLPLSEPVNATEKETAVTTRVITEKTTEKKAEKITESPFKDISKDDWFYKDALYAYQNNLFGGTSQNTFSPYGNMTRAMYVTVIGRMEGVDTKKYPNTNTFTDVDKDSYYAPYVEWAKQMGITQGTGDGKFSPDAYVTREEMATFTVRFFNACAYPFPKPSVITLPNDIDSISSFAKDSVLKMWSVGFFKGDEKGNFNPQKTATRAEGGAFTSRIHLNKNTVLIVEDDSPETRYGIKFDTNSPVNIASRNLISGTKLGNLPIPYKENSIFEGWCYDEALTSLVSTNDTLDKDITLYARYIETAPLQEEETPRFAVSLDKGPNFTIKVISTQSMSSSEVKSGITAKNLNSVTQTDFINVNGSGTEFIISGTNGFEEGASFKITLDDERLFFDGFEKSVRDYNFTTTKEKTLNFSLNADLIYIPSSEITSITGTANSLISLGANSVSDANLSGGTFTYAGSTALKVGDKIAIYDGTQPNQRTVENDDDGDIIYLKITEKSGNSYKYSSVKTEEVLFKPDTLPISKNADTDGNPADNSIKVSKDVLDFSDDIYQNIDLDSQTTADVGDFIIFYNGEFGQSMTIDSYGKIIAIDIIENNYIIEFEMVNQDEMFSSMDAYDKNQISGEKLLENVDKEKIEKSVEKQALKSGFAEEAALYLASLAIKTNSFTELSQDYDLTDVVIKTKDGDDFTDGEIELMEGEKVEVEMSKLQATLSKDLEYFEGLEGLRLTLLVGIQITIHATDKADIVIEITGKFEQEVRIDINVDGSAIWKWWGPFPYISEYEVTASIDLYNYTGIGIEATITSQEADDDDLTGLKDEKELNDIAKQLKDLMDAKDKYIGDGSGTVAGSLADKYKAMIENEDSEWVELFSKEISKKEFLICVIFAVEVGVEFVVTANVNISIGMDFYYANAKRYTYTISVYAETVANDVMDLHEEQYQFEFYVMGTIGLRAGIRAGIKVGLFSTKLASVGFTAEVGAYVRLWGYFYYQLRWTASAGKTTKHMGAMLFELGIYLEIKFEAQAFNGTFSYNPTLYENEWPLWSAGMRENIQDFAYQDDEVPEIAMKKTIQTTVVPDSLFEMEYMDLKTGDTETKVFDDGTNFKIEITNDAFSYNPTTNQLKLTPGNNPVQEGEMIITWITAPLAFTSASIQRRVNLYWDNYNDGYSIAFNSNGGSAVPIIINRFGGNVTPPEAPVKQGYIFDGWYSDAALSQRYTIPEKMPDVDRSVYAKWNPAKDTKYTVEHYTQDMNGAYTLVDKDVLVGTTDSLVSPETKSYPGFETPQMQEIKIKPDGSTKVNYYYKRNNYTVKFDPGEAGGNAVESKFKYGSTITVPTLSREGYDFNGWDKPIAATMPAQTIVYVAQWTPKSGTAYRVEHYLEGTNGQYKFIEFEKKTGNTDQIISSSTLKKSAIEVINGIVYDHATLKGENVDSVKVKSDGSLVVKLYYNRVKHNITFKPQNGKADIKNTLRYEETIALPNKPVRAGYTFGGWYTDEACTEALSATMTAKSLVAYAKWTANTNTSYKVEHYVMGTDGNYPLNPTQTDSLLGTTDTTLTISALAASELQVTDGIVYNHAKIGSNTKSQAAISGDGSLVVKLYYERKKYNLNWDIGSGSASGNYTQGGSVYYNTAITSPTLARAGYTYVWNTAPSALMPTSDCTYSAVWTPNTNTPYTVEYYQQNISDDNYTLKDRENLSGTTDEIANASIKTYENFTLNPSASGYLAQGAIKGDGSLVLKIYYTRDKFTVKFDVGEGKLGGDETQLLNHGSSVVTTAPSRTGYGFGGWYTDESFTEDKSFNGIMPTNDIIVYAKWVAGQVSYKVEHYVMDTTGNYSSTPTAIEAKTDYADNVITLSAIKNTSLELKDVIEFKEAKIGEAVQTAATVAPDNSLVAKMYYERKHYNLSWNLGGGKADNNYTDGSVYYGAPITVPTNLTKTGYTYVWNTTLAATMPASDLSYTANWTANNYTVNFYANGGTGDTITQSFVYDTAQSLYMNTFERIGYTFEGWATSSNGTKKYEDKETVNNLTAVKGDTFTLYALWEPIKYTINYTTAYVTVENSSYTVKDSVTLPTPTHTGYTFNGWYENDKYEGSPVTQISLNSTENKSFYAKWSENSYTVTFNKNSGSGTMSSQSFTYTEEKALNTNAFTRDYYNFDGWSTTEGGKKVYDDKNVVKNLSSVDNEDINLYAVWKPIIYKINYLLSDDNASNTGNPTQYDIESGAITLVAPVRIGYSFSGWYTDESLTNKASDPAIPAGSSGDKTFYAKWSANSYSVTFNPNGGNGEMPAQSFTYDEAAKALSPNSFTLNGYTFKSWNTKADNSGGSYADKAGVRNLSSDVNGTVTLYAQWTPVEYTINYNLYGGSNSLQNPNKYTIETSTITFADPSHTTEGNVFAGWYTDGSYSKPITNIPIGSAGNKDLHAKWVNSGKFTIQNNNNNTFTITRTGGTYGAQTVYYRTLNGSAVGGTHFTHQENSVTIADGVGSATVTIVEAGVNAMYGTNAATSFTNADREYFVEIYKVDGGASLSSTNVAKRTMAKTNDYTVTESDMTNYKKVSSVDFGEGGYVKEDPGNGYDQTVYSGLSYDPANSTKYSEYLKSYMRNTTTGMKVQLKNFIGRDDDWRMWRYVLFNSSANNVEFSSGKNGNIPNLPTGTKYVLLYGINTDTNNTDSYSVNLPAATGTISAPGTSHEVKVSAILRASDQTTSDYVLYGVDEFIGISVGAYNSAGANSWWRFKSGELYTMPHDTSGPDYLGMAPMSNTSYALGSKVTIALMFDEIIKSAEGVTVLTNLSNTAFTYKGGVGTNVLYFEGTVTNTASSASVTTINNKAYIKDIFGNSAN